MSKTDINLYDPLDANNTDVAGVNIAEGCSPANINNALRAIMGALARAFTSAGATIASLTTTGNVAVGGTLGVTGASTFTSGTFSTTLGVTGVSTFGVGTFTTSTSAQALTVTASNSTQIAYFTQNSGTGSGVTVNIAGGTPPVTLLYFTYASAGVGSITTNGATTSYNTTSDYRLKDIYGLYSDSGALIDAVPVYLGAFKSVPSERRAMFLAHELQSAISSVVYGERDAVDEAGAIKPQQVDHSALVPLLWAEIKALRARLSAAGI